MFEAFIGSFFGTFAFVALLWVKDAIEERKRERERLREEISRLRSQPRNSAL